MPDTDVTPTPVPDATDLSKEDWLIIDEALHRVARSLRKIEKEAKLQKLNEADRQLPANQR